MTKTNHNNIQEAVSAFQSDLPQINLDGSNPHFKSKFATLANITKVVMPKLAEHGLSFSMGSFVENGVLVLDAHLMHTTGTSRSMQIPTTESNPQKLGSFISYMRRYALAALTGVVADEDDDGNAASIPSAAERQIQKAASRPTSAPKAQRAQAEIRAWINEPAEGWEERRDKANAAVTRLKAEKVKSTEIWGLVAAEVIPEVN